MRVSFFATEDRTSLEFELTDEIGPLNSWEATNGYYPKRGTLTFGGSTLTARGCGINPCWVMHGARWDSLTTGDTGTGINNNAGIDNLPAGEIEWTILSV